MSCDLLLEIGTEDLPARYVQPLAQALRQGVLEGLISRGLSASDSQVFATPRRIATRICGLDEQQPDQSLERLGPSLSAAMKDGVPTQAALGFASSCGVSVEKLTEKNGKLFFSASQPGRKTSELIAEIFEETLKKMDQLVPKRMRWGSGEETFVRPVEWLCCLLGEEVVPLRRFGLVADRKTFGHRFHAPAAIELQSAQQFEAELREAFVLPDFASRKEIIRQQILDQAAALKGHARVSESLLDEVTALVEWPVAIRGSFGEHFLELPPEVIVSTVETNQRYFTVFADASMQRLTHHFITVSNISSGDVAQVISGNERVVRPRLTDALFFWEQDLKQPLDFHAGKLAAVTFQKQLGSTAEKVLRMQAIAQSIAAQLSCNQEQAARAAALCKADLQTRMVFEMPELQGIVGGYYAAKAGESAEVAKAISEHYLPAQQGTPIPSSTLGQIISLADKLDTLAGIFAIGQKPTASKDPYALRRAALGVLRICIEAPLPLNAVRLILDALSVQTTGDRGDKTAASLRAFMNDRMQNLIVGSVREHGKVTPEIYDAAFAVCDESMPTTDLLDRIDAVLRFNALPEAAELSAASKRARNILKQAGEYSGEIRAERFIEAAEKELFAALEALTARNAALVDYADKLINLASLRGPVDAFFDKVMVNADDTEIRNNRLALLSRLDAMCLDVADLSCLPGTA